VKNPISNRQEDGYPDRKVSTSEEVTSRVRKLRPSAGGKAETVGRAERAKAGEQGKPPRPMSPSLARFREGIITEASY